MTDLASRKAASSRRRDYESQRRGKDGNNTTQESLQHHIVRGEVGHGDRASTARSVANDPADFRFVSSRVSSCVDAALRAFLCNRGTGAVPPRVCRAQAPG